MVNCNIRNDEMVERGRLDAAARVTAHVNRVMFDMKVSY